VDLIALAGKFDGDNEGQVAAIENLVAQGVKGLAPARPPGRRVRPQERSMSDVVAIMTGALRPDGEGPADDRSPA
jgi:hypothetical protein